MDSDEAIARFRQRVEMELRAGEDSGRRPRRAAVGRRRTDAERDPREDTFVDVAALEAEGAGVE